MSSTPSVVVDGTSIVFETAAASSWEGDLASMMDVAAASPLPVLKSPKQTIQVSDIQR